MESELCSHQLQHVYSNSHVLLCCYVYQTVLSVIDFQAKEAEANAELSEQQTHPKPILSSKSNHYGSSRQEVYTM